MSETKEQMQERHERENKDLEKQKRVEEALVYMQKTGLQKMMDDVLKQLRLLYPPQEHIADDIDGLVERDFKKRELKATLDYFTVKLGEIYDKINKKDGVCELVRD